MANPRATYIRDLLEEHFEELEFLLGQRRTALRSPDWTPRTLADLDERIEGHVQGLLVAEDAVAPLLAGRLAEDDPSIVRAAAYALLYSGAPAAGELVVDALVKATAEKLETLRDALCWGPIEGIAKRLEEAARTAPAPIAAAAVEALAAHGRANPVPERLDEFLAHDCALVRQIGCRLIAILEAPPQRREARLPSTSPN